MEIDEVKELRSELESLIRHNLEVFRSSTGVIPIVNVDWPDAQTFTDKRPVFAAPVVTVELRL